MGMNSVCFDAEFSDYGGQLLSIGLVSDRGELYLLNKNLYRPGCSCFVQDIVLPVVDTPASGTPIPVPEREIAARVLGWLQDSFAGEPVVLIADVDFDFTWLRGAKIPDWLSLELRYSEDQMSRYAEYFDLNPDADRHNAICDARALRYAVFGDDHLKSPPLVRASLVRAS